VITSTRATGPVARADSLEVDGLEVDATEREFWAIVCAEEDLLRTEVEELLASLTPRVPVPPRRADRPGQGSRRLGRPRQAAGSTPVPCLRPEPPTRDQRSPPRT
jgi:hypothetical protein